MSTIFWLNNPSILLNNEHIFEVWPTPQLTYESKLNAVTRLIILLSTIGFMISQSYKILISGAISIIAIVFLYKMKHKQNIKKKITEKIIKEGFINSPHQEKNKNVVKTQPFTKPTTKNPMMNVLLTDINDNPKRAAAAPSFDPAIEKQINEETKKQKVDPRLFTDLGDALSFEQSMQRFYTTANSRVVNDQMAFAKFCYGGMKSCKDGDSMQCVKNNQRLNTVN